jgi:hypothetical protein
MLRSNKCCESASLFKSIGIRILPLTFSQIWTLQFSKITLPYFHFDADPDPVPAFHFDADPEPASQDDADPCGSGSSTLEVTAVRYLDPLGEGRILMRFRKTDYLLVQMFPSRGKSGAGREGTLPGTPVH